jgi:hypothetical protein
MALIHLLQICEEQQKYLKRMKDQAECDTRGLRVHLFTRGHGELLSTERVHRLDYRTVPYRDRFLNSWYRNSVFVDLMEDDDGGIDCDSEPETDEEEDAKDIIEVDSGLGSV